MATPKKTPKPAANPSKTPDANTPEVKTPASKSVKSKTVESKSVESKSAESKSVESKSVSKPVVTMHEDHAKHVAATLISRAKQAPSIAPKSESAEFKKLKESLAKPQHSITSSLSGANKIGGGAQGASAFARQVAHNQNAGANFNKTGVPRRTSGG